MKKLTNLFLSVLSLSLCQCLVVYGNTTNHGSGTQNVVSTNDVTSLNNQNMQGQGYGYGEGGDSYAEGGTSLSDSDAIAVSGDSGAYIITNSVSNYKTRTSPVSMFPPYLPSFQHSGWGTVQGYFPNGPTTDNSIYERAFFPGNPTDMKELRGVIESLPYDGPINLLGGLLNGFVTILGGPDNFHHGRGFEIASSVIRKRRPENKPIIIMIDSQINKEYLNTSGYTYVGKISLEGKINRNWDHVYEAAIAEALPWDVDVMLVSGGMKGVTIGSSTTLPSAGSAYSQTNYSLSLLGGHSTGITEGKGEAMVSAECYRYYPQGVQRRTIPESFYNKLHAKAAAPINNNVKMEEAKPLDRGTKNSAAPEITQKTRGVQVSKELFEMAGFNTQQQVNNISIR
jgi:hypothetical protein